MDSIAKRASDIFLECTQQKVKLVLVTKGQPIEAIKKANISPHIIIAENKVQEAIQKKEYFESISNQKHFIGHVQKNKIASIVSMFNAIESIDSLDLLYRIDAEAIKQQKKINVFLQINISEDTDKYGFSIEDIPDILSYIIKNPLSNVEIIGIFTILKNNLSPQQIHFYYGSMLRTFEVLQKVLGDKFCEISMGMSSDYQIAIQNKSTMVRIGTAIFSEKIDKK